MDKNPTKTRLMVAGLKLSVKLLSKDVKTAIKLMYKQIENYNFKTRYCSGIKTFWLVQGNQSVIDTMSRLNSINKAV